MEKFIGTKIVSAEPCNSWKPSGSYTIGAVGYKVVYDDGYTSWSPKSVFEESYRANGGMNFGDAINALKTGFKVARSGWNGKSMWLLLVPGSPSIRPVAGTPYSNAGLVEPTNINPHIDMYTATGDMQPGWLASQSDMLAEDWAVVE